MGVLSETDGNDNESSDASASVGRPRTCLISGEPPCPIPKETSLQDSEAAASVKNKIPSLTVGECMLVVVVTSNTCERDRASLRGNDRHELPGRSLGATAFRENNMAENDFRLRIGK